MSSNSSNTDNFYKTILEVVPVGFIVIDSTCKILYINDHARQLLQLREPITTLSELPQYLNYFKNKICSLKPQKLKYDVFFNIKNKLRYFEFFVNAQEINGELIKYLTFLDKTEDLKKLDIIKSMQDDLFQFKNLAAMGTMISGIAHELNNPISGISMSSQLAETSLRSLVDHLLDSNEAASGVIDKALESISYSLSEIEHVKLNTTRAAKLIGGLLNYSKKEKLDIELCNLNNILEETLKLTKHQPLFNNTEIEIDCSETINLNCDKIKIQQVIYNILKNAFESIDENGLVKINCKLKENFVTISISDNGAGIAQANLGQLFTPFFTTKGPKGGTGLGLSISYRIIEQHGGKISVKSKLKKGSEFIITLPTNLE